ncbi:neurotrophin-7 isoform X2 [Scophthalmus maximus]|uniref:neurotrophin-7 isoform X2 n=1 Tax=Scophthalmus maximus TaxID=52904 RepID=UPI0015E0AC45|nr:neurotrophin-7 isoform X2 [Scophthalmus maximus]
MNVNFVLLHSVTIFSARYSRFPGMCGWREGMEEKRELWFRGSRWQARGARPALESGSRVHRGSHFNWTHSTGRVPMRSSPLVLLLLIGVQAVLNMGGGLAQSAGAANHRAGQQTAANQRAGQQQRAAGDQLSEHHSSQEHHRTSHHRTKRHHRAASHSQDRSSVAIHSSSPDPSLPVVDPKLFSKRRYRSSPRVVFSEVPPSHDALEGEGYDIEGVRGVRVRRRAGSHTMHRGEYSVCDSINTWVGNLTRATDIAGNEVTVLPNVTINNVVKKQFFYETTCRYPTHRGSGNANGGRPGVRGGKQGPKSGNSGCLGIDSRHWNSYCTNTHIFVSALTTFKERTAWRFIRINAACVCVLSRKSWAGRLGH